MAEDRFPRRADHSPDSFYWPPNERWRPIHGFTGYHVSDFGRVANLKTWRLLTPSPSRDGLLKVVLHRHTLMVHRLLVEAFIPDLPVGYTVRWVDGDKQNNCLSNLRIVAPGPQGQMKAASTDGFLAVGEAHGRSILTEADVLEIRGARGTHPQELADAYSVSRRTIGRILNRQSWTHVL